MEAASNSTGASEPGVEEKMAAASISEKKEEKEGSAAPEAAQSKGHPLETGWTVWFDKTPHTSKPNSTTTYTDHLKILGSFRTIEEFWDLYTRLTRPCDLTPTSHYHVFREGYMPMWETFPKGGCWIIRFKKEKPSNRPNVALGKCWEELVFGVIGEAFAEPDVVGVVLSVKPKEDVIQIWNRDNEDNTVKFEVGEKIKSVMTLEPGAVAEYKEHALSIKDPKQGAGPRVRQPWLAAIRTSTPGGGQQAAHEGESHEEDDSHDEEEEEPKKEDPAPAAAAEPAAAAAAAPAAAEAK